MFFRSPLELAYFLPLSSSYVLWEGSLQIGQTQIITLFTCAIVDMNTDPPGFRSRQVDSGTFKMHLCIYWTEPVLFIVYSLFGTEINSIRYSAAVELRVIDRIRNK